MQEYVDAITLQRQKSIHSFFKSQLPSCFDFLSSMTPPTTADRLSRISIYFVSNAEGL